MENVRILDHQGQPMLILGEVAALLGLIDGDRLESFEMFWNVVTSNATQCILYANSIGEPDENGVRDIQYQKPEMAFTDPRPSNVNIPVLQP